jgi:hypothetical protein
MSTIVELFNVKDPSHVKAYIEMSYKGAWPLWFKNKFDWNTIEFPPGWKQIIDGNMVYAYARKLLGDEIFEQIRKESFGK